MAELLIYLLIIALYTMGSVPKWLFITSIALESISIAYEVTKLVIKAKNN